MTWIMLLALQASPQEQLAQMTPAEDLEVRLFAHEPDVINPTCIDVDSRGRVWVCEGVNYRGAAGPQSSSPPYFRSPARKTGDRIVVLEDTDGDGVCDRARTFYEGLDIQVPLGIAVIGDKVWISQAPDIFTIDINPDGTAGEKKIVLTGFHGLNSDHAVHSVYVGPDARLYGCFGNEGANVAFPDGRRIRTDGRPHRGGCAWRSNLDLSGLEVLAHNYRNNYECATDSFGTTFMSDNDDDGNEQVRFTYVMEGGDFGYAGMPQGTHWHMEVPGVVPNLMRTGAGSPAGLAVYEGTLLPERYRGMPVHAEAGPGVVQCFRLSADGAGFRVEGAALDASGRQTIETLNQIRKPAIMLASKDRWFRPIDVAVAPDGSLFVADWYDPGVGGHAMGDSTRGRVFRVVPKGHNGRYEVRAPAGLAEALASPCVATRATAILRIREMGATAISVLKPLAASRDRVTAARALFMLGTLGPEGRTIVRERLKSSDPDFRVLAIRSLRQNGEDVAAVARGLVDDPSSAVRRELLLSLRESDAPADVLVKLAMQYDGYDRWYLEAVAIAFRGREAALVPPLLDALRGRWDRRVAGLLWVLRRPEALSTALSALENPKLTPAEREAAIEAFDGVDDPRGGEALLRIVAAGPGPAARKALEILARKVPRAWRTLADRPELSEIIDRALSDAELAAAARALAEATGTRPLIRWRVSPTFPNPGACEGFEKVYPPEEAEEPEKLTEWTTVQMGADGAVDLRKQRRPKDRVVVYAATVLYAREPTSARLLIGSDDGVKVWVNRALVHRNHQARALAPRQDTASIRLERGVNRLLLKIEQHDGGWGFVVELEEPGRKVSEITGRDALRPLAPAAERLDPKKLPPDAQLLKLAGDATRGRDVFFRSHASCAKCHRVKGEGGEIAGIGPDLSAIGVKAGKENLLASLLRPSEAIAPEYVDWIVTWGEGEAATGIAIEETAKHLTLRDADGRTVEIVKGSIKERRKSGVSSMPDGLIGALTAQELADLLTFLAELRE
jgi:putative membrane-bound dehydrogenase-like protein